ncbi:MAG: GNAT family N-acetyltransferase [Oscillospiraceae bacterium]|nr:GNAT family N-acetyltransferase [Oscillospiraceae bacterium]
MEYNKRVRLKDGRECHLRNGTEDDGRAVFDIFMKTHEQTDYLLSYPDENSFNPEEEGRFLKDKTDSPNAVEILAEVDGAVVGTAGIEPVGHKYKVRHRADFGISVDMSFWGLGIGRALTEACIDCAKEAGFLQLELSAVAENERALALYRSAGFTEYGRNPKGFRSRVSGYQEVVYMLLELGGDAEK